LQKTFSSSQHFQAKSFFSANIIFFCWLLLFIVSMLFIPNFSSGYNLKNYLENCAPLLIVVCGLTFITFNGGIDFSITSVISMGSAIGAYVMVYSPFQSELASTILGVGTMLLIGFVTGYVNGLSVSRLKMPSFVATLATMLIGSGIAVWFASVLFEKTSISGLPAMFLLLGGSDESFWIPILIAAIVFLFSDWLMTKNIFGRQVFAVGVNPKAAAVSGISVKKTVLLLSVISGIYAGIACIIYTARNGAGIPTLGSNMFINIVGSVIIGGTSPTGGSGSMRKSLYGVLFLVLIDKILNLLGTPYVYYDIIKGLLILLAAMFEMTIRRINAKAAAQAARQ